MLASYELLVGVSAASASTTNSATLEQSSTRNAQDMNLKEEKGQLQNELHLSRATKASLSESTVCITTRTANMLASYELLVGVSAASASITTQRHWN